MGNYNDIWTRVVEFESEKKERRRKVREEKSKQRGVAKLEEETVVPLVEDVDLCDEAIEGEERPLTAVGETTDYRVIKNYLVPPFIPGSPNLDKNGALRKYKDRFGKYLAFVDCVKYFRSSKYCSILALATTSQVFLNIWGSEQNVSNAFKRLEEIGLIKEYSDYYQTGMCKLYCYFVENERLLIEYCKENSIPKMTIPNKQVLTKKQAREYQERCEEVYSDDFRKSVLFKSHLKLKRPKGVKPGQFKKDLCEMLCENYPGLRIYQEMAEVINDTYYNDQPEFQIRFKPKFHWNENPKKERSKDKEAIVGIGIRASNKLCSAKKDNDSIGSENKKILREEILTKYGFKFKKDITSSVPRVAYAINHGGWLKEDIDLYEKIYLEINPDATREEFETEREAIKKLLFRVYFDSTDNKLAFHTWNNMNQEGLDRESVYEDMIKLRRAMEDVLGETRHDNYIFYVESCIYIDTLHSLLEAGYKVWLVYDCFYGTGFGTQEEFEKVVIEAVWVSFVRFKAAHDFDEWGSILRKSINV